MASLSIQEQQLLDAPTGRFKASEKRLINCAQVDVNQLMHLHSFGGAGESAGPSSCPGSPPPPKDPPPKEWEEKFV